jgi:hypothetical protein
LRQGTIGPADLSLIPATVGLRFLPTPASATPALVESDFQQGGARWSARAELTGTSTHVTYARGGTAANPIQVRAAAGEERAAADAVAAVLARGIDLGQEERPLIIVFEGGNTKDLNLTVPASEPWMRETLAALPGARGGSSGNRLVVETPVKASAPDAAHLIERVASQAFMTGRSALEVARIPAPTLAEWSRPPSGIDDTNIVDEGDRRWFWGAVLVLLMAESFVRRARATHRREEVEEARVA